MNPDKFLSGLLATVSASVIAALVLAAAGSGLTPLISLLSLSIGLAAGCWAFIGTRSSCSVRLGLWDRVLFTVFALASLRAFLWLIYPVGDEWRILSPHNLGDISLHLQFIRYLASGVDFWPASPILVGAPLSYPLGVDMWNSLLLLVGMPVERGLIWCGLIGSAITAWALWRWGGAFAVAALLFNGGLAGFAIFHTGQLQDFQSDLAWKNFYLTMFVTQRGLLYALPCGLWLLRAWREDFFGSGSGLPRSLQFFLYASLPFFSVHTFLFLSAALAAIFMVSPSSRAALALFVAAAVLPATAAVWWVSGGFSAGSGLRWLPG